MNNFNENEQMNDNLALTKYLKKSKKKKLLDLFIIIIIILNFSLLLYFIFKKTRLQRVIKENNLKNNNLELKLDKIKMIFAKKKETFGSLQKKLKYEAKMPHLNKIIKKRTFDKRLPLPKEIKCKPHLRKEELSLEE